VPFFFSVIVPTYNRPEQLRACLLSLRRLDYPREAWELLVVNDGGIDPRADLPSDLRGALPMRVVDTVHQGPAAARNAGAQKANGTHLAFTDDDCRPLPDWLSCFAEAFATGPWDALTGRTLNPWPESLAPKSHQYLIDFIQDYQRLPNGDVYLACSNNAAYRREVFEALGGYDPSFPQAAAEDHELSHRLVARGFRQGYRPEARVWHDHPLTVWHYLCLQFRYGQGDDRFRRALLRNRLPRRIGQRRRPPFHLALAKQLYDDRAPAAMWALLALAQGAHFFGSRYQRLLWHA